MIDPINPGDTIYVKIVFSEPVQHVVADDENAHPVLFMVTSDDEARYRVVTHDAAGEDFQSGDCKPLHDGAGEYICKYTVPMESTNVLTLKFGMETADGEDNTLKIEKVEYTAPTPIENPPPSIQEPPDTIPPTVVKVEWYADEQLTEPIVDPIHPGDTIYIQVVFSEPVEHVIADDVSARRALFVTLRGVKTQYRVVAHDTSEGDFQSGDCKPLHESTDT